MKLVWATATDIFSDNDGAYECAVLLDGQPPSQGVAVVYPQLCGQVAVGDRVLLNTTAVELSLGTGGKHFVVARVKAGEKPEGVSVDSPSAGHIMKLRYTPMQLDVLAVESQESPHHNTMVRAESLERIPVVCCGLHSQVPLVAATVKRIAPHVRVGYVMTDQAALSLALSNVIRQCKDQGLIDLTVSTGQAFGGDLEAVNVHSGMLAACHVGGCDVLIVAIGPGVAGTGTPFGHGGVVQGEVINAVGVLDGTPIVCLRMSFADARERHQVISHHTLAALERIALAQAYIAIPFLEKEIQRDALHEMLDGMSNSANHQGIELNEVMYREEALRSIKVTTMGRSYSEDPAFFEAASAAGATAAMMSLNQALDQADLALQTRYSCDSASGCSVDSCTSAACPIQSKVTTPEP